MGPLDTGIAQPLRASGERCSPWASCLKFAAGRGHISLGDQTLVLVWLCTFILGLEE